ncbi:MAG: GatB/YqeY domain-containing protein [Flavobacteriaceae bacterium]|nr:GatB/YqeY domain-containing protein [Flavobacteriaceae bacterium]
MSLQKQIMVSLKEAMKSKDKVALESLRAIKSELLLAQTKTGSNDGLTEEEEIKLLQKLVKQRKESALIFTEQGREDLATPELAQVAVIAKFLPEQMSEAAVEKVVVAAVEKTGASSMKDMGKVMGMVSKELAGKADGKMISLLVKKLLA